MFTFLQGKMLSNWHANGKLSFKKLKTIKKLNIAGTNKKWHSNRKVVSTCTS